MVSQKPSVLIVDDEQVVCDLLYEELSERGCLCTTAFDGNDALGKLATQDFDVALVDIRMPGISGMDVLKKIRLNHSHIAAIMITAVNDVETAVEAMKLGASDYIVKPFDLDKVNDTIRTALKTKRSLLERSKASSEMNAIARGVEAKLDSLDNHSKVVVERTVELARQLGISERKIQRWAAVRSRLDAEQNRIIDSSLSKLERTSSPYKT